MTMPLRPLPALLALVLASASPLVAGTVTRSPSAPVATAPASILYSQLQANTEGRVISHSKLFKDREDFPANGSTAVLVSFTVPGTGSFSFDSFTVQIDTANNIALNDDAFMEVALYRNDNPRDNGFSAVEATASRERFDMEGFRATAGDYLTFRMASPPVLERGVQYGIALHWTLDSVPPNSILDDRLLLRLARTHSLDAMPGEGHKRLTASDMAALAFPPAFGNLSSDDPVLVIVGTPAAAPRTWAGLPFASPASDWVDTGDWLGWVHVKENRAWIDRISSWVLLDDPGATGDGSWAFLPRATPIPLPVGGATEGWVEAGDGLGPLWRIRDWAWSPRLDRWIAVGSTTTEGTWIWLTR